MFALELLKNSSLYPFPPGLAAFLGSQVYTAKKKDLTPWAALSNCGDHLPKMVSLPTYRLLTDYPLCLSTPAKLPSSWFRAGQVHRTWPSALVRSSANGAVSSACPPGTDLICRPKILPLMSNPP